MKYLRIYIRISNEQGEFFRIGKIQSVDGLFTVNRYLTYHDRNVKEFRVYLTDSITPLDDSAVWYCVEYKATPSNKANISWTYITHNNEAEIVALNYTQTTADLNAVIQRMGVDPNRVLVSTAYKPRNILGRNAHYIGNNAEDEVLTFAANAKAISLGQFGQYPLYAFCKNSVWAMEVGSGDVAFSRISPVNISLGIVGKDAIISTDGNIVYGTKEGIKTIPSGDVPLSYSIQNTDDVNDILKFLNEKTVLGYFVDTETGRKELFVSTVNGTYCFSFDMQRWFMTDGNRNKYSNFWNTLIGLSNGSLVSEGKGDVLTGQYRLAPLGMGDPNVPKRFQSIIEHGSSGDSVKVQNRTDYEIDLYGIGIDYTIKSFDVMSEVRYTHRLRSRRKLIDVGTNVGYGRNANIYKSANS